MMQVMAEVDTALLTSTRKVSCHIVSCRLCRVVSCLCRPVSSASFRSCRRCPLSGLVVQANREAEEESQSREKEVKVGSWQRFTAEEQILEEQILEVVILEIGRAHV